MRSVGAPASILALASSIMAAPVLKLETTDANTGRPLPARFSLEVNGVPFQPDDIGPHGVRFLSLHDSKKQFRAITYTRGTFPVEIRLLAPSPSQRASRRRGARCRSPRTR